MEYNFIGNSDPVEFREDVNKLLAGGWRLFGELKIIPLAYNVNAVMYLCRECVRGE